MLICTNCGKPRETGRTLCKKCYLESKRKLQKERNKVQGLYKYRLVCKACNKKFEASRKTQKICNTCKEQATNSQFSKNPYIMDSSGQCFHRVLTESILGRILDFNEVIHHIDCNPVNNAITNLLILNRQEHTKLHLFIREQLIIVEKTTDVVLEAEAFTNYINFITATWLQINNCTVIKLWEIRKKSIDKEQSQSESKPTKIKINLPTRLGFKK